MKRRSLLSAAALGGAAVVVSRPAFAGPSTTGATADQVGTTGGQVGTTGDQQEFQSLATAYLADRASRITAAGPLKAAVPTTASEASAQRVSADRLDAVRRQLNALHGGYRRAATSVSVSQVTVDQTVARVRLTEQTDLHYAVVAAGDVDHMTYWAEHELELQRNGSQWLLAAARYLPANPFSTPATQFADELPADMRALDERRALAAQTAVQPAGKASSPNTAPGTAVTPKTFGPARTMAASYNYSAMVNYARSWATGRNPAYPSYDDDCTNFTSQVMRAGGWATVGSWPFSSRSSNSNWWYGSYASTSSYTWGGAENWYWFATGSGRTYIIDMWSMSIGDVLQYDYDFDGNISHTQVCTGSDSTGPLMTQHGSDYRDKRLTEIMASSSNLNAWKYAHRT